MVTPRGPVERLRLGTRGSALARAQADRVIRRLAAVAPGVPVEPVVISTQGDIDKSSPLTVIGGRGVFTAALQDALRAGEVDAAVHSAKDLPSEEPPELVLAAFPEREDARDVLVSRHGVPLAELPARPTIGTSSRRRAIQVRLRRPDARIVDLRGNVDTRLRKALETDVDGIVLAAAGVRRLGWDDQITEELPLDAFVPSPGQGALVVEARANDVAVITLLTSLDDPAVSRAVRVERAFLAAIGGGCASPIGAHVVAEGDRLHLRAMLASSDGERVAWADEQLATACAGAQAAEVARRLLERLGGAVDVRSSRSAQPAAAPNGRSAAEPGRYLPLAGLVVLVTRARAQAAPLSQALREQGAEPVELAAIRIEDPFDPTPLDAALTRLATGDYDWLVFTSANAVAAVLMRLDRLGIDRAALGRAGVAAVGTATASALRDAGVRVDLVPEQFLAEAIVATLGARGVAGRRVLYPCSDRARDALPEGLRALGAEVDEVESYRTVPETQVDRGVRERIARGEVDVVTFASPSSVHGLATLLGGGLRALERATIVCVGPVTASAVREAGLTVDVVADDPTVAGLVSALVRHHVSPFRVAAAEEGDRLVTVNRVGNAPSAEKGAG